MPKLRILTTADGSKTLYLPDMDEQYHSLNGAVTESQHVFIESGYVYHQSENPVVLEVGFGTGLNCLLTAIKAEEQKRKTAFYTVEKYPLSLEFIDKLNYGNLFSKEAKKLFEKIHSCKWQELVPVSNYFQLCKMKFDLTSDNLNSIPKSDIIYFDAFGPDKQPEMWTPKIFNKIYDTASPSGILVTYSAKGEVRRRLTTVGFSMKRLPGPPGKKEMLRGVKVQSNI